MDLDALRFGNFSKLGDAITDWEEMTKKLETLSRDAEHNLKGKADKANWAGVNSQVSRDFIDKTAGEFGDAHTQANTIARILKDTHGELTGYRKQLNEAIDRGLKKNLTVMDTGHGGFTVTMNIHPDRAAEGTKVPEHSEQDVDNLRDEVQKILKGATDSDDSAAKALRLIVDQAKYGFSDADYKDRDSAARAIKAAEDMAELMKKDPKDLSDAQLKELNENLTKYGKDPLFAETLATTVGPKKTLQFWTDLADPQFPTYDPERENLAKSLQKSLGTALGTATLSDSAAMDTWEKQMVDLGPQGMGDDPDGYPKGFQVMSALMRFGDYDDQFLNDYGDKLIAYDKEFNTTKGPNHWINNWDQCDLNFYGKGDRGRDPMTGFLEALGHNPDASTQFFGQPDDTKGTVNQDSELNDHLKYLTKERDWWSDQPQTHKGYMAGQDALGHALEAATTGYSFDAEHPTPGNTDHRNAATAGVMEQVVYLYGGEDGPKMLHDHPELADSLGKMASAYIDDIDYNMSGIGDHGRDADNFPAKYAGRADFGNDGAINFLSVLGQNEDSHKITSAAQHIYTLSLLQQNPPTDQEHYDRAKDALMMEAQTRGVLDHSRVQQAAADYGQDSDDANKSLGKSTDWIKWGVGAAIGAGVACIPGGEGAGLAIVPIAADTAGSAVEEFIGQGIDNAADKAEDDPLAKSQMTSQKFFQAGSDTIGDDYDYYFKGHSKQADYDDVVGDLGDKYYGTGPNEDRYRGRPPYKD
ncbi:hypothetical protein GCM10018793_66030 [Streptomyces sulfonofaciens]|uniref:AG2 protein n=1 Tax=Streptomyces sulfonofaciens TaxID=68272 RepID=A0A919GPK5_9ACTN|nr:DUF6571 family protein [Streptomyces sulfonofaciens]GHH88019.1 hypothetical protein GCM10018793_66030 [Streptomyces sulfonofaciens]